MYSLCVVIVLLGIYIGDLQPVMFNCELTVKQTVKQKDSCRPNCVSNLRIESYLRIKMTKIEKHTSHWVI